MWQHNYEPIAGSLGVSALVAAIPIFVLFVMLGALRKPAWMSAAAALVSAMLVALFAYGMPVQLALISTLYGAAYGLFPIAWIRSEERRVGKGRRSWWCGVPGRQDAQYL